MEVQHLKNYIIDENLAPAILEKLGCHNIKDKGTYWQCGNPDGDNQKAVIVYKDNLKVIDYTRNISSRQDNSDDIFTLVQFFCKCSFFQALKSVCEWLGFGYYTDLQKEIPESLKLTKLLVELNVSNAPDNDYIEKPLEPISEKILSYYKPYVNDMFAKDYIKYSIQALFEIGYDEATNRITIPIRDEIGSLVGVKGRYFGDADGDNVEKYLYIEPCNRGQILYGLDKTYNSIIKHKLVYVTEAEKGVLQMFSLGYTNVVATSGKKVSQNQIAKLTRLCVDICFIFDKDVLQDELQKLAKKFIDGTNIFAVIDNENILNKKESPSDNPEKLSYLLSNCVVKLK